MKFQILLLGAILCLGLTAQGQTTGQGTKSTQSANRMKRQPVSTVQQSATGCVDEQSGHYVLRDAETSRLINLQSPNSNDDAYFAKYVGHKAQISGAKTSDSMKVTSISQVADMCGRS